MELGERVDWRERQRRKGDFNWGHCREVVPFVIRVAGVARRGECSHKAGSRESGAF